MIVLSVHHPYMLWESAIVCSFALRGEHVIPSGPILIAYLFRSSDWLRHEQVTQEWAIKCWMMECFPPPTATFFPPSVLAKLEVILGQVEVVFPTKWWRIGLHKSEVKSLSRVRLFATPCSSQGFSVHGIFQARVLAWVAISFSRGSSWPRDGIRVSPIAGRHFTIWATREAYKEVSIWEEAAKRDGKRDLWHSGWNCVDSWTSRMWGTWICSWSYLELSLKTNWIANK